MTSTGTLPTRRFELDWLRVLAIAAVFLFHSARFFDPMDWHLQNSTTYPALDLVAAFAMIWMMPLLFVVSGASTFYALRKYAAGQFLKDRALRLLVPLVVGVFTHVAWQVYLERTSHGQFYGSFWQFLPHYFDGLYAYGGNFAWMGLHLWYLEVLFAFSVLLLPLFAWLLRSGTGRAVLARMGDWLAVPGAVYLLALPVALLVALPDPSTFLGVKGYGGWSLLGYLPLFVNGFLVVSHDRLYDRVRRGRWVSLALAAGLTAGLVAWYSSAGDPTFGTARYTLFFSLYGLCSWCWELAILGLAARYLGFGAKILGPANEAVLPFYVMHQTVLLAVGSQVIPWRLPALAKWALIAPASLALCLGLYWLVIRPLGPLRFLFGMRPKARPVRSPGR